MVFIMNWSLTLVTKILITKEIDLWSGL